MRSLSYSPAKEVKEEEEEKVVTIQKHLAGEAVTVKEEEKDVSVKEEKDVSVKEEKDGFRVKEEEEWDDV